MLHASAQNHAQCVSYIVYQWLLIDIALEFTIKLYPLTTTLCQYIENVHNIIRLWYLFVYIWQEHEQNSLWISLQYMCIVLHIQAKNELLEHVFSLHFNLGSSKNVHYCRENNMLLWLRAQYFKDSFVFFLLL